MESKQEQLTIDTPVREVVRKAVCVQSTMTLQHCVNELPEYILSFEVLWQPKAVTLYGVLPKSRVKA